MLERRLRQRIAELQEYRAHGVRTLAEADAYETAKHRREAGMGGAPGVRGSSRCVLQRRLRCR
jgi:hypothetical protein